MTVHHLQKGEKKMSKPIKNYPNYKIGYFVNYVTINNTQPFQMVGTYAENETETPGASYLNDEWFEYITTVSKNKRPIFNNGAISYAENDISVIDDFIINNYSSRDLFVDDFYTLCDYDFKPLNNESVSAPLLFQVNARSKIRALLENKRVEYNRIWEIQTANYNPLKDYEELIVERHSGTDTTAHTGTDTTAHTGTDTTTHSGKDTTQNSGTDTTTHSGTESTGRTGTDTLTNSGTDTVNESTFAFDSVNAVDSGKSSTVHGKQEQTAYNTTETLTHNNSDALSHGLKTELTHGESIGVTHGKSVATTHGESIGVTHGETVTYEKSGSKANDPELLNAHREFWENFNLLQIIAEDIIKTISV